MIEEFNASGGLKILTAIVNLLAENNIEVLILVQKTDVKAFYNLSDKITIEYIGSTKDSSKVLFFFKLFFKLICVNDVIITSNFRLSVLSFITRLIRFDFKKIIFLIQGLDSISIISNGNLFLRNINQFLYFVSKNISANRVFVSNHVFTNYNKKGLVIPNYVGDVFFDDNRLFFKENIISIGIVSTSSPNKGFDFFLESSYIIRKDFASEGLEVQFICATPDKKLLESNISEDIKFVFPKNEIEMSYFYSSCDILLSCSVSEGFNLPVLEAMASGCIVVATDDGAVNDLITNELNGYILAKRDVNFLSSKLLELVENKNKLNKVSREARLRAENFLKVFFDEAYLKYFKNIL
ncbi:glycosyltransferase family 4 protein [Flavobacterium ajazii]|uniref:glycosyltransferase family 4 protein n=1 Tax=Flavobacterium ajazii TaxID=2692318 RepID=UPI0013D58F76|nr:glycosyltransferase family 4 protein [Flavobacterium ajazii]